MDPRAAERANRLLGNPAGTAVLEWGGHWLVSLQAQWVALCGGEVAVQVTPANGPSTRHPTQRTLWLKEGDTLRLPFPYRGRWLYLAVPGGFHAPEWLGSRSALAMAGIGIGLQKERIVWADTRVFHLPAGVAGRTVPWQEIRKDADPSPLPVWPGPQAGWFPASERAAFFAREWTVSRYCDRVGYRLEGLPLAVPEREMISEPQPVGTIQIARDGRPIVIMPDGPAVGGYAKIGIVDPVALPRLAQRLSGERVRFQPTGKWP